MNLSSSERRPSQRKRRKGDDLRGGAGGGGLAGVNEKSGTLRTSPDLDFNFLLSLLFLSTGAYFDDTLFALKNATARDKKAHDGRDKSSSSTKEPKSASTSSTRTNGNGRRTSTSSSHLHSSSSSSHHHSSSSSSSSSSRTKTKTSTSSPTSTSVSAPESLPQIKESEVLIFCPMFLNLDDFGAFPVSNLSDPFSSTSSALVWNVNDWMFGGDSVLPNDYYWSGEDNNQKRMENGIEGMGNQKVKRANDIPGISSFEVLDEVIAYFANSTNFPALETINVVGHSAG